MTANPKTAQSAYDDLFLKTVPKGLTADELGEWLAGAGYCERSRIEMHDFVSVVFTDCGVPSASWPTDVAVLIGPNGNFAVTPHYAEPEHEYSATCECDECEEAREEDAALRKAGQ